MSTTHPVCRLLSGLRTSWRPVPVSADEALARCVAHGTCWSERRVTYEVDRRGIMIFRSDDCPFNKLSMVYPGRNAI